MSSDRPFAVAAVAVALLAGLLRGVQSQLPPLLADAGFALANVSLVVAGATIGLFVLDPLVLFAVGYGWGQRAAVRAEYATFAASVLVVALVGYGVAHVLVVSTVATVDPLSTAMSKTALGVAALGFALRATLAAVAGGAVAEFRSRDVRATRWSETDD
jgi:hypothetical protein